MEDSNRTKLDESIKELEELLKKTEEKQHWSNKLASGMGALVAYMTLCLAHWACWNYALIVVFPSIPAVTPLQMAGLWWLANVLLPKK